jgi:preprotein translocase subunit SecA
MAGRGTDIVLGGNPEFLSLAELGADGREDSQWESTLAKYREQCAREREEVLEAGGLKIIGTERHESRRIDNQLRGRSGRQGDPGASRFYISLQDDLMRIFGAERIEGLMSRLGMEEGVPIEAKMVSKALENAQRKVEGRNFDMRKHLLEYDDVMNKQREIIYGRRKTFLQGENLREEVLSMARAIAQGIVATHLDPAINRKEWDWKALDDALHGQFRIRLPFEESEYQEIDPSDAVEKVLDAIEQAYAVREEEFGEEVMRHLERVITLQAIDGHWKDHLLAMDHLKEGIGLRGYGQRNPLQEYQREGFDMFAEMMDRFDSDVVEKMYSVQIAAESDVERIEAQRRRRQQQMIMAHAAATAEGEKPAAPEQVKREGEKIGRNDPCPCGSGKKYKKCHGRD